MMSDAGPSRKRPRSTSPYRGPVEEPVVDTTPAATRDKEYYFPDGNCIMLVESTLFNVHRSLLSRDSSTFSELFALPQGESTEGASDSNPVILRGETAKEIRNFLWAIYALPHEHRALFDEQSDISKLLDIVKISKKYCMSSVESWACDAVLANISRCVLKLGTANSQNAAEVKAVVHLAAALGLDKLLRGVFSTLKQQFPSSDACLIFALNLCHELDSDEAVSISTPSIQTIMGEAYYSTMLRGPAFWDGCVTSISPQTKLRILLGYYRLSQEWIQMSQSEPVWASHHHQWCSRKSQKYCETRWKDFWKQNYCNSSNSDTKLADVRGRLEVFLKAFDEWSVNEMNSDCKKRTRDNLQGKIIKFEEKLADYFRL